jgi:uncharacterized protein YoxC
MIPEEMQRTMQFILEQQAQLTATVERIAVKVDRNTEGISALLAIVEIQAQEIKELGEAVRAVDGRQREADGRQREADERQREADEKRRESDERLNALINTVERYISERRNGKP